MKAQYLNDFSEVMQLLHFFELRTSFGIFVATVSSVMVLPFSGFVLCACHRRASDWLLARPTTRRTFSRREADVRRKLLLTDSSCNGKS